jgi:outer membrane protein
MKKHLSLIFLLLFGQAQALDLTSAYYAALNNDAVFVGAKANFESIQQKLPISRAGLLPVVALSANTNWNNQNEFQNPPNTITPRHFNSNEYSISLTQPLFRWQNWVGYDQSKLIVGQAEVGLENARQDLILRVSQAYFDVIFSHEILDAAKSLQSSVGAQLSFSKAAFRVGTGVQTDVFDAQSRLAFAGSQVIAAETDLEGKSRILENIIGTMPVNLPQPRKGLLVNLQLPSELNKWVTAAEQTNLTVQQQQLAVEIANLEVDKQRAGHYPTLDVVASSGRNSTFNSGIRDVTDGGRVGVQLTIPIFQGGEVKARVAEAIAGRNVVDAALIAAKRNATLATRVAYLGVNNGMVQIKILEQALQASQDSLESTKAAFDVGIRLGIDVLNAQNQVYTARRDLARATLDTLLAQLKLKAAVGTLGESDVVVVNALINTY